MQPCLGASSPPSSGWRSPSAGAGVASRPAMSPQPKPGKLMAPPVPEMKKPLTSGHSRWQGHLLDGSPRPWRRIALDTSSISGGRVPEVSAVREAIAGLNENELTDVLAPLQLEELLMLSKGAGDFGEAVFRLDDDILEGLVSPIQREMLVERHHKARKSTMMCGSLFNQAESEGSAACVHAGGPMLPTILARHLSTGRRAERSPRRQDASEQRSRREPSTAGSDSTEGTATGGSPTSSVSWISDDGRGEREGRERGGSGEWPSVAPDSVEGRFAFPGEISVTALRAVGGGAMASASTTATSPAGRGLGKTPGFRPSPGLEASAARGRTGGAPAPRYASYRQVPSWEEMAAKTAERMSAWAQPNGAPSPAGPPWEVPPWLRTVADSPATATAGGCGAAAWTAPTPPVPWGGHGQPALIAGGLNAASSGGKVRRASPTRETPPVFQSLFERAQAAQRRSAADAAAGAGKASSSSARFKPAKPKSNPRASSSGRGNSVLLSRSSSCGAKARRAGQQSRAAKSAIDQAEEYQLINGMMPVRETSGAQELAALQRAKADAERRLLELQCEKEAPTAAWVQRDLPLTKSSAAALLRANPL
eukprot:gnl/TRDRNA2_/TRDRNA2_155084_c0_seq1.p1 gnl/TRDRNA2_/TRDRNA2_155084_c0~~gnl/TRDRNA2_/TRDRNA2_155084_c0_seq1.p1  ORF type:complete len:595 (+),score=94.95 gnl/TRDRNA2_/TRDRNA2_155084_c0_seq1:52-1836(+)